MELCQRLAFAELDGVSFEIEAFPGIGREEIPFGHDLRQVVSKDVFELVDRLKFGHSLRLFTKPLARARMVIQEDARTPGPRIRLGEAFEIRRLPFDRIALQRDFKALKAL